jgi:hypothetical protein
MRLNHLDVFLVLEKYIFASSQVGPVWDQFLLFSIYLVKARLNRILLQVCPAVGTPTFMMNGKIILHGQRTKFVNFNSASYSRIPSLNCLWS